jgi:hypothetical protein
MKIEINPQESYLVKSTDGLRIRRYNVGGHETVGVTLNPTAAVNATTALRLAADWLDCGYIPVIEEVV